MNQPVPAIETRYKGYKFRSRLEARWAVFFDQLGIQWQYEKERFDLPSGKYLPDFWLSLPQSGERINSGYWVEIKPPLERREDLPLVLLSDLTAATKHNAFLLSGDCWMKSFKVVKFSYNAKLKAGLPVPNYSHFPEWPYFPSELLMCTETGSWSESGSIEDAFVKARSARFEHGETP